MFVEKFLVRTLRITTYILVALLVVLRATGADDESLARQKRARERATLFEGQATEIAALRAQVAALAEQLRKQAIQSEWVQYAVVITIYYIPGPNTSGQNSVSTRSICPNGEAAPFAVQLASRRRANDSAELRRTRRILNALTEYVLARYGMVLPEFIAYCHRADWQERFSHQALYGRIWWAIP